jgi:hypothetical protein
LAGFLTGFLATFLAAFFIARSNDESFVINSDNYLSTKGIGLQQP